jgi:hypothetical protein
MRLPVIATIVVCAAACSHANPDPGPAPAPAPAPEPRVVVRTMTDTVRVRDPELERQVDRLEAKVAERDTRIADLEVRLEEAQEEVVRTMASAPGSTLRAEAASAIAEAEVAVKSPATSSDIATAKKLLDRATEAFNTSNFRGARYLADQAKALVAPGRREVIAARTVRPGERAFDSPVGYTARQRANVRAGPSTRFKIVFRAEKGTRLTGESYSGDWILVSDQTGRKGWIVKSLLVPAKDGAP